MGRKVGVVGREDGVGMELEVLVVAVVLTLLRPSVDTESRDCGRRMPVGIMLCESALPARLLLMDEGESNELVDIGRKAVGAPDGGAHILKLPPTKNLRAMMGDWLW